jgi:flagellar biosynthesis protein FlhF
MIVRKFVASSTREALRLVRDTLGANAIILSNRTVDGEIEVMAVAEGDFDGNPPDVKVMPQVAGRTAPEAQVFRNARVRRNKPVPAPASPIAAADDTVSELVAEVRSLKQLVETQLSGFAWGETARRDPARPDALRQWIAAGFSPDLGRAWLEAMPPGSRSAELCANLRQRVHRELQGCVVESDLVEETGIFALVGPTGVGKTTTVAKIGARCALRHGAAQLAFVTTDSYRVGAEDQLRVYGKLLGAPVFSARDGAELDVTLEDIRRRRLVLVDTIGMGQRDQRLADQLSLLTGAGHEVQRILVLSANTQLSTLEDVVQRYSEGGLAGCILTKIDEAVRLGEVLDTVIRHQLPIHYLSNGQRVPEDLHRPNPLYLADRAFRTVSRLPPVDGDNGELALYAAALETRGSVPGAE